MNFYHSDLVHPVESSLLSLVKLIDKETNSEYFLIGATARDIIFHNIFGFELSARATEDCDIAVCVQSWEDYHALKTKLIENYKFRDDPGQVQRLFSDRGIPVDLIPFGGISVEDSINWPDSDNIMSVVCYETAKQKCNKIIFEGFDLKLVSIEMFVSLKLVAWDSRKVDKDLSDIVYVIENYANLPLIETQITDLGIAERYDDINKMAAAALAFNMRKDLDSQSLGIIHDIFQEGMNPKNRAPLIRRMQKSLPPHSFPNTKIFLEVFYGELKKD